jgi:hypothetical protein
VRRGGRIHRREQPDRARVHLPAHQYAYPDRDTDGDAYSNTDRHANKHVDAHADKYADRDAHTKPFTNVDSHSDSSPAHTNAFAGGWREVD